LKTIIQNSNEFVYTMELYTVVHTKKCEITTIHGKCCANFKTKLANNEPYS
jgi:hypothetical protein